MAKFHGILGYIETRETRPGVWEEITTEHECCGDLLRNTNKFQSSEHLNDDINVSNEISIIADPYARNNFHLMRYVCFDAFSWLWDPFNFENGIVPKPTKWKVVAVEVQYPRLILTIGGVYNE